jgi:hypothetical protein
MIGSRIQSLGFVSTTIMLVASLLSLSLITPRIAPFMMCLTPITDWFWVDQVDGIKKNMPFVPNINDNNTTFIFISIDGVDNVLSLLNLAAPRAYMFPCHQPPLETRGSPDLYSLIMYLLWWRIYRRTKVRGSWLHLYPSLMPWPSVWCFLGRWL